MNPKYKKVYCCTPFAFHADDGYFIRDTGLISNTLRSMGVESKCIMPLPFYDDDQTEHLIRTEYKNLESAEWWKSLGIDALVLYSWGAPRYRRVARAVHEAGIRLIIHLDTAGKFEGADWDDLSLSQKVHRYLIVKIIDFFRARHLKNADIITVNKAAAEKIAKRLFFGGWFKRKLALWSTPVASNFDLLPEIPRSRKVVCVGRWSDDSVDAVKRPVFMIETAKAIVAADSRAFVEIYGRIGETVKARYDSMPEDFRKQICLKGPVSNHLLPEIYNSAQVSICTSKSEGTHIASAEAMCCGCSLVIPPRKSLETLHWYTSKDSGTVAKADTPESMAASVIREFELWEKGERVPEKIASAWQPSFRIDQVIHSLLC